MDLVLKRLAIKKGSQFSLQHVNKQKINEQKTKQQRVQNFL